MAEGDLTIAMLPNYTPEMVSLVLSDTAELITTLVDGLSDNDSPAKNDVIVSVCRTLREMATDVC